MLFTLLCLLSMCYDICYSLFVIILLCKLLIYVLSFVYYANLCTPPQGGATEQDGVVAPTIYIYIYISRERERERER